MVNINLIYKSIPALLDGAQLSLFIAGMSSCVGILFGTILALGQTSKNMAAQWLVTLYVTIIRGTPMLIQITFFYFVLPQLGLKLSALWAATIAIGLNSAAYVSQIIKSGIMAVSRGQREAAQVLGFSQWQTIRFIILPQALITVLPALGNEFITLIKDSSLASIIGVMELAKQGSVIRSQTYDVISTYVAVGLIYLTMTTTLSVVIAHFEKRYKPHAGN